MTNDAVIAKLRAGAVSGLWHCHHKGLHSVILEQRADGSLLRIFYAEEHSMNRVFGEDGHFIIGAHNHDKRLTFQVLFGDVWNVDLFPHSGINAVKLYRYQFGSALQAGDFTLGVPMAMSMGIELAPINGRLMKCEEIHTVLVCSSNAAWLVDEGPPTGIDKYIFSPRSDLRLSSDGLYRPMSDADLRYVCGRILEAM